MNRDNLIAVFVREERKKEGLTQEEFAVRSGLSLKFVRDLEQGKETVRMDKVNQALRMFSCEAGPVHVKIQLPVMLEDDEDEYENW